MNGSVSLSEFQVCKITSRKTVAIAAWWHHTCITQPLESLVPSRGNVAGKVRFMVVRQNPRFPALFSGTLGHQNRLHRITKSLDLSRKGCRLESSLRAIAGMKVDLLLYVPDGETPILIEHAVVRWSGRHGIGIEFQSLASPHRERLDHALQQLEAIAGHS